MGPKPAYTLWPHGQAGDSAGSDQRADRPGHDDQIHGRSNIGPVDADTKLYNYSLLHSRNKEYLESKGSSLSGYRYAQMGTLRNSNGQRKELHHRLRKTWKHYRDQLQRVSLVGELDALYRRREKAEP